MQLLVVRHGIAMEREAWAREHSDDSDRPLTAEGKKKMKECAKGLRALVPRLDVLATSPLTRALQTAAIMAKAYEKGDPLVMVSWFTAGTERSFLELGKGGAGLLDLGERIEAGEGMLLWVLRPSHLRALA